MEFRILGPLEVADEARIVDLGGQRERTLLARLLISANLVVSAGRLAGDLWSGEPPPHWPSTLRVYISRLRRALGPGAAAVLTEPSGYRLSLVAGQAARLGNRFRPRPAAAGAGRVSAAGARSRARPPARRSRPRTRRSLPDGGTPRPGCRRRRTRRDPHATGCISSSGNGLTSALAARKRLDLQDPDRVGRLTDRCRSVNRSSWRQAPVTFRRTSGAGPARPCMTAWCSSPIAGDARGEGQRWTGGMSSEASSRAFSQ